MGSRSARYSAGLSHPFDTAVPLKIPPHQGLAGMRSRYGLSTLGAGWCGAVLVGAAGTGRQLMPCGWQVPCMFAP